MIKLEKYGVELRQINQNDLEKIRQWRTDPEIARWMDFRGQITPEMQAAWFEGVQARGDLYFLIRENQEDVGVIDLKKFDWKLREAEGGIFMSGSLHFHTLTPYRASLCLIDFAFEVLCLERIQAHILDENRRAIRYNQSLGYEPTEVLVNGRNRRYYLSRERYLTEIRSRLQRVIHLCNPGVAS